MKIIKDPLTHFLALGFGLFLLYAAFNPDDGAADDPRLIVVDRDALLTFVQYRTKIFQPNLAAARFDAMSDEQLNRLIDDYVREDALYREARSLGLERNDYLIKRRMIQKIGFITQGFGEAVIKLGDDDIKAYHEANRDRYREPALITFTHVFFNTERREMREAKELAEAALVSFRNDTVAFSDAPKHGENFPYGVNYVERTKEHVTSQFGREMTEELFALQPVDNIWYGPFQSPYGAHLVMVVKRVDARFPPLRTIRNRIEYDLKKERQKEQSEKTIKAIVDSYTVEINLSGKTSKGLAQADERN